MDKETTCPENGKLTEVNSLYIELVVEALGSCCSARGNFDKRMVSMSKPVDKVNE